VVVPGFGMKLSRPEGFIMSIQKRIVGIQVAVGAGFFLIAAFSWVAELIESFALNRGDEGFDWVDPTIENAFVVITAVPAMVLLRWLLSRLDYLEGLLSVCAWCRKVDRDGEWLSMDEFFAKQFQTEISHGICGACLAHVKDRETLPGPQAVGS
jgi:hypothetical protein